MFLWGFSPKTKTVKPSLEVALTTLATFSAGFAVSSSGLLFCHGRPFQQLLSSFFSCELEL